MAPRKLSSIVRYFQQVNGPENGGPSDAELLDRYVRRRDEAAFELLLWRHGALVLNVCRRVLHREEDAEDAFQATFLAFVRKASSILRGGSVAGWLYKVAYRVSLEARARAIRAAARERPGGASLAVQPSDDPLWNDVRPILDEEVNRLPERLRLPFVLCYLEGKTNEEAARQLGCRPGTVYSRLARGREMLRRRLTRRGVTVSGVGLAAMLAHRAAEAAPAAQWIRTTMRNALLFAGGPAVGGASPRATALAEGVLRTMFLSKIRSAALALFVLGLLATGGVLTRHALTAPQEKEDPPARAGAAAKADKNKAVVRVVRPEPGGFKRGKTMSGRVIAAAQQQVYPAVSGYLKQQPVELGSRVKKGDLLAEIDSPLLVKDVEQAAASLELAKAQLQEAKARVVTSEAELGATRSQIKAHEAKLSSEKAHLAFREKQLKRYQELLSTQSIEARLVEEQESRREAAREAVTASEQDLAGARGIVAVHQSKIESAQALLRSVEASVRIAQVALEKTRIQLGFTQIRSNFNGVVTRRSFDVGEYVTAGEQGGRRPLLTVQRTDLMRVRVDVAEFDVPVTRPGIAAELESNALPGVKLPDCKVSRVGYAVDRDDGNTMPIEIDVPNSKDLLRPGMLLNVKLYFDPRPNTVRVPYSCLFRTTRLLGSPREGFVYIVRDGKAHLTQVRLGTQDSGAVEVLSGLRATDLVVADVAEMPGGPSEEVRDKVPVEIKKQP